MNSPARVVVYVALLALGLACMPPFLFGAALDVAVAGFVCMILVQLRTTRNDVDHALARIAFFAACVVLLAPAAVLSRGINAFLTGGAL